MKKIVILTGAGISAESGLGTFRDTDGIWSKYNMDDVATPEGFARNPQDVHAFYNARRANALVARPNAAHRALARLAREWPGEVIVVTQNVDNLHERAGQPSVVHMHGELSQALCNLCGFRWPAPAEMSPATPCPACAALAARPDVVWFGEAPYHMEDINWHLSNTDLFAAIGTSGQVFPAAGFVMQANAAEATTVELNLERSDISGAFDQVILGKASEVVPMWVDNLLAQYL